MASITDLAAASSVAAGDELAINQSGTDRRVTADKFLRSNVANAGKVILGPASTLVIAAGTITVTGSYHLVDTEASAATDDLVTINGGAAGQWLIIRTALSTRDVVLKHATGNIVLSGAADLTLATSGMMVQFIHNGTNWIQI